MNGKDKAFVTPNVPGSSAYTPVRVSQVPTGADNVLAARARKPWYPVARSVITDPERVIALPTGQTVSTPYGRDPFRTEMLEVVVWEMTTWNFTTFVNDPLDVDPVAAYVAARMLQMYTQIVDVINYNGRFVPNPILVTASDFTGYLNSYATVFGQLYTILSVIQNLDVNASMRSFSGGVSGAGNLDRAITAWERLQNVPIPPKFVTDILQPIVGVFFCEPDQHVYLGYVNPASSVANVTDWTSSAAVSLLIGQCETLLGTLESTGAENPLIGSVLGQVYGVPANLPEPVLHTDPILWDLWYTQIAQFLVTAVEFATPTLTALNPGGIIPILIRNDVKDVNPLAFSLLRPAPYSYSTSTGQGGTAKVTGIMTQLSTTAGYSRIYTTGAGNNTIVTNNTFGAINFGNGTQWEVQWWSPFEQSTSGVVGWQLDTRSYDRWDVFYADAALLGAQTIKLLDVAFMTGINLRDRKSVV